MLFRFSLYGFLKNQRYFEPFLVLVFLDKGLSFFVIGLLIAFREATVNLLEIPSGAMADVWGRRRAMVASFASYIVSFLIFGAATGAPALFLAMFFFGVGETFRTGTHKAMIFAWLRLQGRTDEKTRFYGYTRSWSKFGSAVSVVLAAVFVVVSDGYAYVFYLAAIPYAVGIVNFLGYPRALDGGGDPTAPVGSVLQHMRDAFRVSFGRASLRRLMLESMGFEGVFHTAKDYLQPVLQALALGAAAGFVVAADMSPTQQTALLVGPVYFVLHVLSGVASRLSHRVAYAAGGEEPAAHRLWGAAVIVYGGMLAAAYLDALLIVMVTFVLLHVLQNLWRPVLISRFDSHSDEQQGATVLSIESQSRRAATMLLAPALGFAVDLVRANQWGGEFWPVGLVGTAMAIVFFAVKPKT